MFLFQEHQRHGSILPQIRVDRKETKNNFCVIFLYKKIKRYFFHQWYRTPVHLVVSNTIPKILCFSTHFIVSSSFLTTVESCFSFNFVSILSNFISLTPKTKRAIRFSLLPPSNDFIVMSSQWTRHSLIFF